MTKKGKHVPLRGGHVSMKSGDRSLQNKPVLPEKGKLFGSERLGNFGGVQGGEPIVKGTKRRRGESGFGI